MYRSSHPPEDRGHGGQAGGMQPWAAFASAFTRWDLHRNGLSRLQWPPLLPPATASLPPSATGKSGAGARRPCLFLMSLSSILAGNFAIPIRALCLLRGGGDLVQAVAGATELLDRITRRRVLDRRRRSRGAERAGVQQQGTDVAFTLIARDGCAAEEGGVDGRDGRTGGELEVGGISRRGSRRMGRATGAISFGLVDGGEREVAEGEVVVLVGVLEVMGNRGVRHGWLWRMKR
ncbi:hypothetical protein NL676_027460 [Syzygium grande]|nr:hypothetical protein NL676_027460 [Syzygium grande]